MFDERGIERLSKWKQFRDSLEISKTPLEDTLSLWKTAPFVFPFLDPYRSDLWPDPWELVMNDRLDDLAIALGIMYTLKLTQRFMGSDFEIHMSTNEKNLNVGKFFVVVDKKYALNYNYGLVSIIDNMSDLQSNMLYRSSH